MSTSFYTAQSGGMTDYKCNTNHFISTFTVKIYSTALYNFHAKFDFTLTPISVMFHVTQYENCHNYMLRIKNAWTGSNPLPLVAYANGDWR
jgi:hypothetical protein